MSRPSMHRPMRARWLITGAVLGWVVAAAPAQDPDNCLLCHQFRGLSRLDVAPVTEGGRHTDGSGGQVHLFFVDPDYVTEQLGAHARLACTQCHPREEVAVIPHRPVSRVDCTQTCHIAAPDGRARRFTHAGVAAMLERSVHNADTLAHLEFAHGPVLGAEQSRCLYCHDEPVFRPPGGSSQELLPDWWHAAAGRMPALPGASSEFQQAIDELSARPDATTTVPVSAVGQGPFDRCTVCHAGQVPVDLGYYVKHIASRLQRARTPISEAQVCAVCHTDRRVLATHELPNAVRGFARSFHGRAALLGDQTTASCLSCHVRRGENVHLMLGKADERSSVHANHVADSCRSTQCHPGAEPRIASASVHLDLPVARATLEFALALAFILLTLATFGPSLVICLMELAQIAVGRHHHAARAAEDLVHAVLAHPKGRKRLQRFTVSQRWQHWILVILFAMLAITGFPMKFADQDWARVVVDAFGGLAVTRVIHHYAGLALVAGFIGHAIYCINTWVKRARTPAPVLPAVSTAAPPAPGDARPIGFWPAFWTLPMVVHPRELLKAQALMAYLFGFRKDPPTWGRFSIKEKFEYIGVFWGTTLLGITGVLLWGEQYFSRYISGRFYNIAVIAHTYEAFLAMIHVGILHIVNVMFSPHVFPLSRATITGETPVGELAEQHADYVADAAAQLGIPFPSRDRQGAIHPPGGAIE